MQRLKLSSVQLMLTFFVCGCSVILLQNFYDSSSASFTSYLPCILLGILVSFLYCVPSILIKKRNGLDFPSFAHSVTPSAIVFVAAYYAIFFVYAAQYFLLKYTDMFIKTLNPEADENIIALILIAVCIYAGHKGINSVTRCGIFIFAFSILAFIMIFSGNPTDLDFENNTFVFSQSNGDFITNSSVFMTVSFVSVFFAFTLGYTEKFRVKHIAVALSALALVFALSLFFIWFVLGEYGKQQPYQMFLLSKSAHIGAVAGIDSFFLSLSALSVFLIISLIFISIGRVTGKTDKLNIKLVFSVIIFILFICAQQFDAVKEILTSSYIFNILIFIAAVLIPGIYLIFFRRRSNA